MISGDGTYRYVNPKFTEIPHKVNDVPDGRTGLERLIPDRGYSTR